MNLKSLFLIFLLLLGFIFSKEPLHALEQSDTTTLAMFIPKQQSFCLTNTSYVAAATKDLGIRLAVAQDIYQQKNSPAVGQAHSHNDVSKWPGLPDKGKKISLTKQEAAWLENHPMIRVSSQLDYPPFDFVEKGKPAGFSIDYLNLVGEQVGLRLEFIQDTWENLVEMGQKKEIDLLHTIFYTPEREAFFRFTEPYKSVVNAIYVRDGVTGVKTLNDLAQKKIILPKGDTISEILPRLIPNAQFIFVDSYEAILKSIALGQGDATVLDSAVANYLIRKLTLTNIFPVAEADIPFEDRDPRYRMAIRKDWPELQSVLQKAMNTITRDEMAQLESRWFGSKRHTGNEAPKILLSDAEQKWLDNHRNLRLGMDPDWPPYDFIDASGKHRGISADVLALLSERLGINMQPVSGLTWSQVLDAAQSRSLDIVSILLKTPKRSKYLKFTSPIVTSPFVIVTAKDFKPVAGLGDMTKDRVAMVKDYAIVEQSRVIFPDLAVQTVESALVGLQAVSIGQMDAFVGNLCVVSFLIQKNGLVNLKIASRAGVEAQSFSIGVRSDWPELVSILNKAIADISTEQMNTIHQKWIPLMDGVSKSATIEPTPYKYWILYAITVFMLIGLLFMFLIRVMQRENIAVSFGSPWFRGLVLTGLSIFVIMVAFLGWYALERNKTDRLNEVDQNLRGVLSVDQGRLDLWLKERISYTARLGRDPELVDSTRRLLKVDPDKESLLKSDGLRQIRSFFKDSQDIFPNIGFFIINPDCVSIGSMRDGNIGTRNLIAKQYPKLIERTLQGETVFVPPMTSDVHLKKSSKTDSAPKPPTMFFLGPIQDRKGQVLAVMTLRVDPWRDLAGIMRAFGNMGTGETYAFDRNARMLTPSRFDDQLQRIGLLTENQNSALNIEIRDPGVNMMKGYQPEKQRDAQPLTQLASKALMLRKQLHKDGMGQEHSPIESKMQGYNDYRGVPVFGAWRWCAEFDMGLAVEIDTKEALANYYQIRGTIFGILGFTLFLSVGAILFILIVGERTSHALVRARDELENKVEERTAELEENQKRFAALLESAPDAMVVSNEAGEIVLVNSQTERLFGFKRNEMLGNLIEMLVPESIKDFHPANRQRFLTGAATRSMGADMELMAQTKDGMLIPVDMGLSPLDTADGVLMVASIRDITERKVAEESLRTTQERFRLILESVGDGILGVDVKGKVMFINSAANRLLGYESDELIGLAVHEKIHHSYADGSFYPVDVCPMAKAYTMGNTETISDEMLWHKDGSGFSVEYMATPIKESERITGAVITFRDITERKRMEEALSQERKHLKQILDTSPVGVAFSSKGIIHFANPMFTKMFNAGVGDPSPDLYVNPKERDLLIARVKAEGEVKDYELQLYDRDGEVRDMLVTYMTIDYSGEVGVLGWLMDITDRKKAEQEIKNKFDDLTRFRQMAIGREMKMIELKEQINELAEQLGKNRRYKIV